MTSRIGIGGDDAGDTARAALARAWALRRPYLMVHLAATALTAVALGPLLAVCARLAAGLSGAPAVADQDIARLLPTPAGLIGVLVLISVAVAAGVLELVVMIALDDDARRGGALDLAGGAAGCAAAARDRAIVGRGGRCWATTTSIATLPRARPHFCGPPRSGPCWRWPWPRCWPNGCWPGR